MPKTTMSYSGKVPAAKDVRDTKMLDTTAREKNATGTNDQTRHTAKHKPFGAGGGQGHP